MFAIATAAFVPMAMPMICRKYSNSVPVLNVKIFSLNIKSRSCSNCWFVGIELFPLRSKSAFAAAILASFAGMLVYRLVTSRVTKGNRH